MKILITGGCGFVGRRFVRRLASDRHEITVIDNLSTGQHQSDWLFPAFGKVSFNYADVRNFIRGLDPKNFDAVIHCAAVVGGRLTIENDPLAVATDLSIDAELFNWIVRGKRKPHLIYFSSSAVYPVTLQVENCHCQLSENLVAFDTPQIGMPDMTYGFAKLAGEYLAKFAIEKYELPVTIYRPFSGYGEDQDLSYPLPAIIRRIVRGENPVTIWGSGRQTRDWIHVDDIVSFVLHTWPQCGVFNIGSGVGKSFVEILNAMSCLLDRDLVPAPDLSKPEGVFTRVADTTKMNMFYRPETQLGTGLLRLYRTLLTPEKQG